MKIGFGSWLLTLLSRSEDNFAEFSVNVKNLMSCPHKYVSA